MKLLYSKNIHLKAKKWTVLPYTLWAFCVYGGEGWTEGVEESPSYATCQEQRQNGVYPSQVIQRN